MRDAAEPIDLRDPIEEICRRLGVNPHDVARITLEPANARVVVFATNEEGRKYVDPVHGHVPLLELDYRIRS